MTHLGPCLGIGIVAVSLLIHEAGSLPRWWLQLAMSSTIGFGVLSLVMRRHRAVLLLLALIALQATSLIYRAQVRIEARLPADVEGKTLRIEGVIDAMTARFEQGQSFPFKVERCIVEGTERSALALCPIGELLRLSWFIQVPSVLMPGQRWQLSVRLKQPHARLNPQLFDAELRLFEQSIVGQGYVRVKPDSPATLIQDQIGKMSGWPWLIERLRHHLRLAIERALPMSNEAKHDPQLKAAQSAVRGVIVALVVGDQGAIPNAWWEIFNQTGVGHLMSISGLHVTMIAGGVAWLCNSLWGLVFLLGPWRLMCSRQSVRWIGGCSGAWFYTALAGFGIPAQRTCWMVTLAAIAVMLGRSSSPVRVIIFTAMAVTVIDPWAPLSAGFWLSFGAVSAIIFFGSAVRLRPESGAQTNDPAQENKVIRVKQWVARKLRALLDEGWQSQVAATLALLPVGAAFFASFALLSPVANAVAIPLVSALVTPLAIIGAGVALMPLGFIAQVGELMLKAAAGLTAPLLDGLQWLAQWPFAIAVITKPSIWLVLLASAGLLMVLAPFGVVSRRVRFVACAALIPLVIQPASHPDTGQVWLTAFDVGQGMAVLVETQSRRLIFDTGPSYGPQSEAGSAVISPYLRARGLRRIDALVVSHLDIDHSGGTRGVLRQLEVGWVSSSVTKDNELWDGLRTKRHSAVGFYPCIRGEKWHWDGVDFEFLHPQPGVRTSTKSVTNAGSCVLRIASKGGVAMLTGDIEAAQEQLIIQTHEQAGTLDALKADVMLVPHHGSKTSSSVAWLQATTPQLAIFQMGYRNRFRHPHPTVQGRYERAAITVLRSDERGAIRIVLGAEKLPLNFSAMRTDNPPYWRTVLPLAEPAPVDDENR